MTEKQIINSATQNSLQELQRLKEKLERAIREGADVDVQIQLKKAVKTQKAEVKDRKTRIKDKVKLSRCQHKIQRIDRKIKRERDSQKPNTKKIQRMNKRRQWWIARQEKIRLAEEKRLQKRVKAYKADMTKMEAKVKYCELHPRRRGCAYYLYKYKKDARIVQQAKANERKIEAKIVQSREKHINTFKNNKNIEVKKAIIINRYNKKVQRAEKRIAKLERKLKKCGTKRDSRKNRRTAKRITKRIEKLRSYIVTCRLEQEKTVVVKSTGPGECSTCDLKILELLNKIYTVIVKRPDVPKEDKEEWVNVVKSRRVKRTRQVRRPHSWTTQEKKFVTRRVLKNFRVPRVRTVKKTEYVMRPREWFTNEKVNQTHYKWVDHKVLRNKVRDVVKRVAFDNWKWVNEKVLVNKPKKFRNQELIEVGSGKFEWKDLGYETRMVPEWETQRRYVKFTDHKNVTEKQPYQQWETEKKWTPYTVTTVQRKRHTANEKVPVVRSYQVKEWVNQARYVDEKVPVTYTKVHHGHKMVNEDYYDNENYTERVRRPRRVVRRTYRVRAQPRRNAVRAN